MHTHYVDSLHLECLQSALVLMVDAFFADDAALKELGVHCSQIPDLNLMLTLGISESHQNVEDVPGVVDGHAFNAAFAPKEVVDWCEKVGDLLLEFLVARETVAIGAELDLLIVLKLFHLPLIVTKENPSCFRDHDVIDLDVVGWESVVRFFELNLV